MQYWSILAGEVNEESSHIQKLEGLENFTGWRATEKNQEESALSQVPGDEAGPRMENTTEGGLVYGRVEDRSNGILTGYTGEIVEDCGQSSLPHPFGLVMQAENGCDDGDLFSGYAWEPVLGIISTRTVWLGRIISMMWRRF